MPMTFRDDIQALRALCVLAVIFYHLGVSWIPGGFFGVDIFFVISGYVIFASLLPSIQSGSFGAKQFLKRRMYRIFPALLTVIALSSVAAFLILTPRELVEYGRSAGTATLSLSNIHFADVTSNYFSSNAKDAPLLHTWSLGVEEQFYLLASLLMLIASWKGSINLLTLFLAAIVVLTFVANIFSVFIQGDINNAFFLPTHRMWQTGLGALLAIFIFQKQPLFDWLGRYSTWPTVLSLLGMAFSFVGLSSDQKVPGLVALVPTLSALLFIAAVQKPVGVAQLFSLTPVLWLGKVSFTLYLVHWPVIVFFRLAAGKQMLNVPEMVILSMITFALSALIWVAIEDPLRRFGKTASKRANLFFLAPVVLILVLVYWVEKSNGVPNRLSASANQIFDQLSETVPEPDCERTNWGVDRSKVCVAKLAPPGAPRVLLWGDSHAGMYASSLITGLQRHGVQLVIVTMPDCQPLLGVITSKLKNREQCQALGRRILQGIEQAEFDSVILVARWANLGSPVRAPGDGSLPKKLFREESQALISLPQALIETTKRITEAGAPMVLVGPTPEIDFDVPRTMIRSQMNKFELPVASRVSFDRRQEEAIRALQMGSQLPAATTVWAHEALCDEQRCRVRLDGIPMYYDDDHLNALGADQVTPSIVRAVLEALEASGG